MPFEFQCPSCGAASRVNEDKIGVKGPCYSCNAEVTIFPPESRVEPPRVARIAIVAGLTWALVAFVLFFSLRSVPTWVSLWKSEALLTSDVWGELLNCLLPVVGAFLFGGALYGGAALVVHSGQGFIALRRVIWIGHFFGAIVGFAVGLYFAIQNPSTSFFMNGEQYAIAILSAMLLIGMFAGGIGMPYAMTTEKHMVRRAAFTAPLSAPPLQATVVEEEVIAAKVADVQDPDRPELTSTRRQELIRRLRVVHQQEEGEADATAEGDAESES